MIRFNPEGKDTLTYGEALDPAMEIKDPDEALQYLKDYVVYLQKFLDEEPREDAMTALEIAKTNLGYYAGYYDGETQVRVEKLYKAVHPIFGTTSNHGSTSKAKKEIS